MTLMTNLLSIQNSLQLPHSGENKALDKVIRASLKRKGRIGLTAVEHEILPWNADLFFLDESSLFKRLDTQKQHAILTECNDFILSESYFIEKAGLAYCAKMILAGETTEIRQMYGLIASDESVHLQWLSPFVKEFLRITPQGRFIYLITKMIDECDANTLYYLVQTILEGWGIFYYKTLATACQREDLQSVFFNIVKDEAIHHKTGVALFDPKKLNDHAERKIIDGIKAYIDALRVGTQDIVSCVEKHTGELSLTELISLFEDLQTEITSTIKLNVLKEIMHQPGIEHFIDNLEEKRYFSPYSAKSCAEIYIQQRK